MVDIHSRVLKALMPMHSRDATPSFGQYGCVYQNMVICCAWHDTNLGDGGLWHIGALAEGREEVLAVVGVPVPRLERLPQVRLHLRAQLHILALQWYAIAIISA
jgi:hypothetical protein